MTRDQFLLGPVRSRYIVFRFRGDELNGLTLGPAIDGVVSVRPGHGAGFTGPISVRVEDILGVWDDATHRVDRFDAVPAEGA